MVQLSRRTTIVSIALAALSIFFAYPQPQFSHEDIKSLSLASDSPSAGVYPNCDTVIVITGVTSGIGKALATKLYELGAGTIVGIGRSASKLDDLSRSLHAQYDSDGMKRAFVPIIADFSDLETVASAAIMIKTKFKTIDYLINNAGIHLTGPEIYGGKPVITKQGYELTFGVNYLSHFLLTNTLLPNLKNSKYEARIVQISSSFHWLVDGSDFSTDEVSAPYASRGDVNSFLQRFRSYANSKLAQIIHARRLNRLLSDSNDSVRVVSVCPGWVSTGILKGPFGKIVSLFAFHADGYGLRSTFNAMFDQLQLEEDFLSNSRLFEYMPIDTLQKYLFSNSIASKLFLRELTVWLLAILLIDLQKFFAGGSSVADSSQESHKVKLQDDLYKWSLSATLPLI